MYWGACIALLQYLSACRSNSRCLIWVQSLRDLDTIDSIPCFHLSIVFAVINASNNWRSTTSVTDAVHIALYVVIIVSINLFTLGVIILEQFSLSRCGSTGLGNHVPRNIGPYIRADLSTDLIENVPRCTMNAPGTWAWNARNSYCWKIPSANYPWTVSLGRVVLFVTSAAGWLTVIVSTAPQLIIICKRRGGICFIPWVPEDITAIATGDIVWDEVVIDAGTL